MPLGAHCYSFYTQAVFVEVLKTQQQKKKKHDQTDGGKWLFGEITLTNLIKGLHACMQKKI